MPGKRILITGGAGFVGYHITKELLAHNCEVIIYDAFLNFIPPLQSRYATYLEYRLNDLGKAVNILRGDIRDRGYFIQALKDTKPQTIIHLAAIPIAKASNQFSEQAMQINLNGTVTVLECIRAVDCVSRFVYTSSSFVYGHFQYEPADEEHPTNPTDIYGGTKLCGEILTRAFGRRFGIEYTIIRPSAVYGPTDVNRRVSQVLIENALSGKPLRLENGGLERVDFTYVKDAAQGFVLAVLSDHAKNETFNITRGEGKSIKEFAGVLQEILPHVQTEITQQEDPRPQRGALAIAKARKLLGYQPAYDLEKGIKEYVEFIQRYGFLTKA